METDGVSSGTTDVDMLITLGCEPADEQPIRGDRGSTRFSTLFPQEALVGVTSFANYPDHNYEKVLDTQPDFILNGPGYVKKVVERLPEITPTYSVDAFDGRNWMEHFNETAEALDRTEQSDEWIKASDERVAEVEGAIGEKAKGVMVAPFGYREGKVASACHSGVECQAFEDHGPTVHPAADANDQFSTYDMEMTYSSLSGQMALLDVVEEAFTG